MAATFKNETTFKALKAPTDRPFVEHWHETEKGFGVRIMKETARKAVRKTFLARYRDEHGKDKKDPIGLVKSESNPNGLTFAEAFDIARKKVRRAEEKRSGAESCPTLEEAFREYMRVRKEHHREATVVDYEKRFERLTKVKAGKSPDGTQLYKPSGLADKRLDEMDSAAWELVHVRISTDHGRAAAIGCIRVVSSIYSRLVAFRHPTILYNPCLALSQRGLMKEPDARTRHVPFDKLPEFWAALHSCIGGAQRDYILWGLMTGFRHSLLGRLAWSRVNFKNKTYKVLATDPGNKLKKEIDYPICDYLWTEVIEKRQKTKGPGDTWILPSTKIQDGPMHSVRGSYKKINEVTGIEVSDHDMRRTLASIAESLLGETKRTSELLMHSPGSRSKAQSSSKVTFRYIITPAQHLRAGAEKVSRFIIDTANGKHPSIEELADHEDVETVEEEA